MTRVEIRPFTDGDIPSAGALLAQRHAAHRFAVPPLDPRFEDPTAAASEVADLWSGPDASGAVAQAGGRMVGYLLGISRPGGWGQNMWVQPAGHAVEEAETVRDLYGAAAARWVDDGRTAHYALVPASDAALVDAWFRLGFGQQHVHALCPPQRLSDPITTGFTIRRGRSDDVAALAELDLLLPAHQGRSPVFSAATMPTLDEALADWAEDIIDPDVGTFVAERDGVIIGSAVACPIERSSAHGGIARPVNAGLLTFAAVRPDQRGAGVGSALGRAVLGWITDRGHQAAVTDWRATNLLSSRTWPRLGFRPTFLRLHRIVGY